MTNQHDSMISDAPNLTPSEQSFLVMRAALLVQELDTMGELAERCQDLRRELAELPYTSSVERDKLMSESGLKREQYKSTKLRAVVAKNNLAKTLYDIQARRAAGASTSEKPLADDAESMR